MTEKGMSGNRGEWSEIYAFLRLLADGKIFAADEKLNKIKDMFFPILKIIREETKGKKYEYRHSDSDKKVVIYLDDNELLSFPLKSFAEQADFLLGEIEKGKGTFEVAETEGFVKKMFVTTLKAPSTDKTDINIQIHDVNTGYEKIVGFSIKSDLGNPPSLLNASGSTNFIYKIKNIDPKVITEINSINTKTKIIDRMNAIKELGAEICFERTENEILSRNLTMIDSQMPLVVAEMLKGYYLRSIKNSTELVKYVAETNPLKMNETFYSHKIKELLCAVALGMQPATEWGGIDEATGGYIVVKTTGEVLAYHIYNRDSFKTYLLNNTALDRSSTSRHKYAFLYEENGEVFIKFNLQIRFI